MERTGDGNVRFRRPDGRLLPESPPLPPLEGDPLAELREADAAEAIEMDEWTVTPDWNGEPFDFDIALGYFLFQGPEDEGGDEGDRRGDGAGDGGVADGGSGVDAGGGADGEDGIHAGDDTADEGDDADGNAADDGSLQG